MEATKGWREIRARKSSPEEMATIDREVAAELREMDLRELRLASGLSQEQVAAALDKVQPEISRLERRKDFHLSTLQGYVHALGGKLEIIASFGKRRVRLRAS